MAKLRFIVVGSGWRSLFYWRIAQALPERFELCAMLCRTEEKAEKMHREYGVPVSTSAEQCIALHPDFVVVAVNKASIAAVSTEWLARGFAVLSETPAALEVSSSVMTTCIGWCCRPILFRMRFVKQVMEERIVMSS